VDDGALEGKEGREEGDRAIAATAE